MLELYCDGSGADRVDRPGGWAFAVVRDGAALLERSGGSPKTTAFLMELEAARAALAWVVEHGASEPAVLISDSRLTLEVASGLRELKAARYVEPAAALRALAVATKASTKWVRGHAGHRWNERVDGLARAAKVAVLTPKKGLRGRGARSARRAK